MKRLVPVLLVFAATVTAQPGATRRSTNLAALAAFPTYFHQRPVLVAGDLTLLDTGELRLTSDGLSMRVVKDGTTTEGPVEVRGEFWDLGRFNADDPRLQRYDLRRTFGIDPEGAWPRSGQVLSIMASDITPATPPAAPSIRGIVLFPSRYLDQTVKVTGQFAGRNLLGDLPDAPAQSQWDFVLRSADAAIWVANIRPRGRDFDLALDARIDTGRWLEVTGTLQQARGLQWLNAEPGSLKLTEAPRETPEVTIVRLPPAPPPEVVFSAPISEESDVLSNASVRIQFSRDMDPATFRGHITAVQGTAAGSTATPLEFTTQYQPGNRVLEIRFPDALAPFSSITVQLLDGIMATDKQPLAPWTLTFETGRE
ncbi:MAG: Ig-like domain-containing protein [Vicinamibacterales bacterium]